jgi:O-antigen/teichoic acid export membrane protein
MIQNYFESLRFKSSRTKNITKHVLLSFLFKTGSILISFLLVPITIGYLDRENYGIWLTISSFIGWFSFFDIGLGTGLQNKLIEAKSSGNLRLAKGYVSTAYISLALISIVITVLFLLLNNFINWREVFNTTALSSNTLSKLMQFVFLFFCIQMVLKLITTIYIAEQNHSMQGKINFLSQFGSFVFICVLSFSGYRSLLLFGSVYSLFPVLILLGLTIYAFKNDFKDYIPSFKLFRRKYLKDLLGLGSLFFIVQISGIILFTTDNFIISQLYSPAEVVPYNITYKYLSISTMLFSIITISYWPSITEAYTKSDFVWIEKAMRNFRKISFLFFLVLILMVTFSSYIYELWVGTKITIPFSLTLLFGLFFAATIFITPFTIFLNSIGKVRIQAIQAIISAIVNIPLAIFLSKECNLGLNGIILSTIICFIPSIILTPIQYLKIINKNANGIWNK